MSGTAAPPATTPGRAAIFDPVAGLYAVVFAAIWRVGVPGLHRWLERELRGARTVLDAGTGSGYWARVVARAEPRRRIVGLDLSTAFLDRARRSTPPGQVEYVRGDLTAAPFPESSFDAVVCAGVLDTLPDPEAALREFRRLVVPGGKVLLILRGGSPRVSAAMEAVFRLTIGVMRAAATRSLASLRVPLSLWSRQPVWARLRSLAPAAGLAPSEVACGALTARALLERDRAGAAAEEAPGQPTRQERCDQCTT